MSRCAGCAHGRAGGGAGRALCRARVRRTCASRDVVALFSRPRRPWRWPVSLGPGFRGLPCAGAPKRTRRRGCPGRIVGGDPFAAPRASGKSGARGATRFDHIRRCFEYPATHPPVEFPSTSARVLRLTQFAHNPAARRQSLEIRHLRFRRVLGFVAKFLVTIADPSVLVRKFSCERSRAVPRSV